MPRQESTSLNTSEPKSRVTARGPVAWYRPLTVLELMTVLSIACCSFALYHAHPVLPLLALPFLLFGLPGRLIAGGREGWVTGTYFGTVAFGVACGVGMPVASLAATKSAMPTSLQAPEMTGLIVLGIALGLGLSGSCLGGRLARRDLRARSRRASTGSAKPSPTSACEEKP